MDKLPASHWNKEIKLLGNGNRSVQLWVAEEISVI